MWDDCCCKLASSFSSSDVALAAANALAMTKIGKSIPIVPNISNCKAMAVYIDNDPNHSYTSTTAKDSGRRRRSSPATRSYYLALEGGAEPPSLGLGAPGFVVINKLFKESIHSNL
ncbi:hypothetical protein AgCh_039235 [Apium graveolens]